MREALAQGPRRGAGFLRHGACALAVTTDDGLPPLLSYPLSAARRPRCQPGRAVSAGHRTYFGSIAARSLLLTAWAKASTAWLNGD